MPTGRKEKFETVYDKGFNEPGYKTSWPAATTVIRKGSDAGKRFEKLRGEVATDLSHIPSEVLSPAEEGRSDRNIARKGAARRLGDSLKRQASWDKLGDERTKYAK